MHGIKKEFFLSAIVDLTKDRIHSSPVVYPLGTTGPNH